MTVFLPASTFEWLLIIGFFLLLFYFIVWDAAIIDKMLVSVLIILLLFYFSVVGIAVKPVSIAFIWPLLFKFLVYLFVIIALFILGAFIHSFFQKPGHLISKALILPAILLFLLYLVSGWTVLLAYISLILFVLLLLFFLTMYFERVEQLEHEARLDEYVKSVRIRHSNKNSENQQSDEQSFDLLSKRQEAVDRKTYQQSGISKIGLISERNIISYRDGFYQKKVRKKSPKKKKNKVKKNTVAISNDVKKDLQVDEQVKSIPSNLASKEKGDLFEHKVKKNTVTISNDVKKDLQVVDEQVKSISSNLTSKEKGDLFEHYVIHRFSRKYFLLKEMRSDKGSDGIYPESNQYPDLVFEYKPELFIFAVECKWRSSWWLRDDNRYWIDCMGGDHKLDVYNRFSQQQNMPVWIVLGVAGKPNDPAELYSIPLHALKYRYAEYSYLQRYRCENLQSNFYLNTYHCTLH